LPPARAGRLTGLAANSLVGVLDALALVRLGRPESAQLRGDLAEHLAVVALEGHDRLALDLRGNSRRQLIENRMPVAEAQLDSVAFHLGAISDADDLERARETGAETLHHVGEDAPRETVQGAHLAVVLLAQHPQRVGRELDADARRQRMRLVPF